MGVYEDLGIPRLVNARCVLGRYGDSLPSEAVLEAMADAASSYVKVGELLNAVDSQLAMLTRNEAALVCGGACDGGKIAIAAAMVGTDRLRRDGLPRTDQIRHEVIMHAKGRWAEHACITPPVSGS